MVSTVNFETRMVTIGVWAAFKDTFLEDFEHEAAPEENKTSMAVMAVWVSDQRLNIEPLIDYVCRFGCEDLLNLNIGDLLNIGNLLNIKVIYSASRRRLYLHRHHNPAET